MAEPTERDPLIRNTAELPHTIATPAKHKNGPLDISPSARYGILAGIWCATFLSVGAVTRDFVEILTTYNDIISSLLTVSLLH
jgi:hypothetical protein